jgi:glycosyltransferase involved in cell wall biosynthesis
VKILYFSPHPHINMAAPSGPGTHIREVIKGFENRGYKVIRFIAGGEELVNNSNSIQYKKRSWKKFIPKYIWETIKDFRLRQLDVELEKQLIQLIQKEKPDFIYERVYYLMGAGYRAAQKTNTKYCCEINAPYPEEKKIMNGNSWFGDQAISNEKKQILASHKIFVVSSALKTYLLEKAPINENKIIVTPNAVNPSYIDVTELEVSSIREKFKIPANSIVLGFVGSIFPYHGVDALIEAYFNLQKKHPLLKVLIVGDGEILTKLKERTSELGISDNVIFTGNIPHKEIYAYIKIMDITVMARSNWYGSPVKIFEYGIMNKCIIAPDVIPVRDVMENLKDGLLVENSISSLTDAISYFLQNPVFARSMAENFHQKVKSLYTWQQVSDTILEANQ